MAVKGTIPSVAEDDAQLVRRLGIAVAAVWTDLSSASQALILEQAAAVGDAGRGAADGVGNRGCDQRQPDAGVEHEARLDRAVDRDGHRHEVLQVIERDHAHERRR